MNGDEGREEYLREIDEEQQHLEYLSAEGEVLNQIEIEEANRTCSRCGFNICDKCMVRDSPYCNDCEANICSECLGMNKRFKKEGNKWVTS